MRGRLMSAFVATLLLVTIQAAEQSPNFRPLRWKGQVSQNEGGFVEQSDQMSPGARAIPSASTIATFMPSTRTSFTFPSPYNTLAWRLTIPSDCNALACVRHSSYSYWRSLSNDGDNLYIYVVFDKAGWSGATGPTLLKLVKSTGVLTNEGQIFNAPADQIREATFTGDEGQYFSASQPTKLYYRDYDSWQRLMTIDVLTHTKATVLDMSSAGAVAAYGSGRYLWQIHSSADDNVHSYTVRSLSDFSVKGCGVYIVNTNTYKFYPMNATWQDFDECDVSQSGQYLHIKERVLKETPGGTLLDSRFIRISDDNEILLSDANGGGGHSDSGYAYTVMADGNLAPQGVRLFNYADNPAGPGTVVYQVAQSPLCANGFTCGSTNHISHLNATNAAASGQWALGSGVTTAAENDPRTNEIIAFKLDGSKKTLVIAPVMTLYTGGDIYTWLAFANVDSAGRYAIWTTNLGVAGGPLTAILVRIPNPSGVAGW